jgi:hypothetical protein
MHRHRRPCSQNMILLGFRSVERIRSGVQLRSVRFVAARPDKKLASAYASPASSIEHPRAAEISSADGLLFSNASSKSKTW